MTKTQALLAFLAGRYGITQPYLATVLEVSQATISRWRAGEGGMRLEHLHALRDHLASIDPDWTDAHFHHIIYGEPDEQRTPRRDRRSEPA